MLDKRSKRQLAIEFHKIGVVQFGQFTFKSGIVSPMYLDHRILISHPKSLKFVAKQYAKLLKNLKYDRMAAIPYAALPIVGAISLLLGKPWLYTRKEVKVYGTKKVIEGQFNKGETVVVVDDLITKGDSKIEALEPLLDAGLKIKDFVVLLDYEKGGSAMLKQKGYKLHAAMTVNELIDELAAAGVIDKKALREVKKFLDKN